MPVLEQLKIVDVCVPAEVGSRRHRFDVLAPVDLNVGHLGFNEPACQQAALTEAGVSSMSDIVGTLDTSSDIVKDESKEPAPPAWR